MTEKGPDYSEYVEHPRYGRGPRFTDVQLPESTSPGRLLTHWHSHGPWGIPGTAVKADVSRQRGDVYLVEYYLDTRQTCRDCNRPFLFFAEEQKHWYEELGFGLPARCVHCPECRKRRHGPWRARKRYQELHGKAVRTSAEILEMVECCLALIEMGEFHQRQFEHARALLRQIPRADQNSEQFLALAERAGIRSDAP